MRVIGKHLYNPRREDNQDEVEPNVGKYTPESRDKVDSELVDLTGFSIRNHEHTQTNDHKHVEGRAANDGPGAQVPSSEAVATNLWQTDQCSTCQEIKERK